MYLMYLQFEDTTNNQFPEFPDLTIIPFLFRPMLPFMRDCRIQIRNWLTVLGNGSDLLRKWQWQENGSMFLCKSILANLSRILIWLTDHHRKGQNPKKTIRMMTMMILMRKTKMRSQSQEAVPRKTSNHPN